MNNKTNNESKLGKWIISSDGYYPYCSECKNEPSDGNMTHICPSCGTKMSNGMERPDIAQEILSDVTKSDDIKLFEVFQLYKDDLQKNYTQLYYALLGWKDAHINELNAEKNAMNNFNIGDMVYADDWCYGEIIKIEDGVADIEFETCGGGGTAAFPLNELTLATNNETTAINKLAEILTTNFGCEYVFWNDKLTDEAIDACVDLKNLLYKLSDAGIIPKDDYISKVNAITKEYF